MSDSESTPGPRRSQREKKSAKQFSSIETPSKRKRTDNDAEEDDQDDLDHDEPDTEEEEEYRAPKGKPKSNGRSNKTTRKPKAKAASTGQPPAKKPRTAKVSANGKATTRKTKKAKEPAGAFDAEKVANLTRIAGDNPLFNAIMNPAAALQSTAEDFLESLENSPGVAQAELVNLILRCCACNDSVDGDEVLDYDGIVDALDNFTEALKKDDSPIYPLTSKLTVFKKFRKSLSEFLERLVVSSADLGSLYASDIMLTLQAWVVAMSSSQIRSFRHTATVVALEVETALCDVASGVEKEAEVISRQREAERKRKASNKRAGGGVRGQELETKAEEIRKRRTQLAEFIKEFVDGVFVHRYRDLDPAIRAECVRAIGLWFKKYPKHFLDAAYLRYVGWVLSDGATHVRLEAVRALAGVYAQADYIGSLNQFTERFKPRLVEMACGDVELGVRAAVIEVLGVIDGHGLLGDEDREALCLLVFDQEPKVRKAVSSFVHGVWNDDIEERIVGRKLGKKDHTRAGVKSLAVLFVKWAKSLDSTQDDPSPDGSQAETEDGTTVNGTSNRAYNEDPVLVSNGQTSRVALAVEALWDQIEPLSDWEGLLDVLLLDHSAPGDDEDGTPARRVTAVVDEAWRLEEEEEGFLLEVLVAALRLAKAEGSGGKKDDDETITNDITRALIKSLPRLFVKYQTDQNRIATVLLIPTLMNPDLYLEMRMMTGYASLWDDVIKQFMSHSSTAVLVRAMDAIKFFLACTNVSNTNSTKILELEDELGTALRDAMVDSDEIEVATFTEDEVRTLGSICARIKVLATARDISTWLDEDEGGQQSSAWDILSAIAERGRLGYKEEEQMVQQVLHLLTLHIVWKASRLTNDEDPSPDQAQFRELLQTQRDSLLEKLVEYTVGTQSNTVAGVKRESFQDMMTLHELFCSSQQTVQPDGELLVTASLPLTLEDEAQYRCAGYIQAEIERYAEEIDLGEESDEDSDQDEDNSDNDADENAPAKSKKKAAKKAKKVPSNGDTTPTSRTRLEKEHAFMSVIFRFLQALLTGFIAPKHSTVILAHHGRLGTSFDSCTKRIIELLRDEGIYNRQGDVVVSVVTRALRESFILVLDGIVRNEDFSVALAKSFHGCIVVRGAQLAVVARLEGHFVVQIHTELLTWIGKQISAFEKNKNKKGRNTAILFFKVLLPLLSQINKDDALEIKTHMDQVLTGAKIEISPSSKVWEPQRAYEKRLSTAIAKENAPVSKSGKVKGRAAATDDESEIDSDNDAPAPRTRPAAARRAAQRRKPAAISDDDLETTPKAKLKPKPKAKPLSKPKAVVADLPVARSPSPAISLARSPSPAPSVRSSTLSEPELHDNVDAVSAPSTPTVSRKRRREEDVGQEREDQEDHRPSPAPTPAGAGEMIIRRKRARY